MLEVTPAATEKIGQFFQGRSVKPIRIFLNEAWCAASGLKLAPDTREETDAVFEIDGYTYVVDKELLEQAAPLRVDFISTGFKISSQLDLNVCPGCGEEGAFCNH